MNSTIPYPLVLEGKHVRLRPLELSDAEVLWELASDQRIWAHIPIRVQSPDDLHNVVRDAMEFRNSGEQYPFVIEHRGKPVGSTRYLQITPNQRKLEIGWTWMHPSVWGSGINYECKFLLLQYAFEQWKAIRVQLITDELNIRSRTAIQKIGAKFEGILRNERIRHNGTFRNTAFFSIISEEWPEVKNMLLNKVNSIA